MGGSLGAKSFPWPTAIGNSPNVSPLTAPQAPSLNGPNGSITAGSPSGAPTPGGSVSGPAMPTTSTTTGTAPTTPTTPNTPAMPVGQPAPYRPILGGSPAFYTR